ncbi:MAG: bifunctional nuclease family protein, partial [Chloroflexi bacterium]|nr:bifunctional nuclease family protein [Chloroflexota bacterium]
IYVEESVLARAGILKSPDIRGTGASGGSSEEELGAFRDFLNTLDLDKLEGD